MIDARRAPFDRAALTLAGASDDELVAALAGGERLGEGIGGEILGIDVDGVPVFVKRVPLTVTERAAPYDTGNLFGLPDFYQYGIGSAGFGAWRELTAHRLTTGWVRSGHCPGFPQLYHWRVLPRAPRPAPGVEEQVAYWDGSAAVGRRLTELAAAESSLTLFLERLPYELGPWLSERLAAGEHAAIGGVARSTAAALKAMNDAGLLHFDAHPGNLLTDGRRVYVTDFGLAAHPSFGHPAFLRAHADYDRRLSEYFLTTWLAAEYGGRDWDTGVRLVSQAATGALPPELDAAPEEARDLIRARAADSAALHEFFTALVGCSKHTRYPFGP